MHMHLERPEKLGAAAVANNWSKVAAFASAIDAGLDRWLSDNYRLGLTEYRALALLSGEPDKELRIAALAERVGLTSTSTTRLVSRLENKGLARRDVCPDDGRGVYAVIDEPGEVLLREVRTPFESLVREMLCDPVTHLPHFDAASLTFALAGVTTIISSR